MLSVYSVYIYIFINFHQIGFPGCHFFEVFHPSDLRRKPQVLGDVLKDSPRQLQEKKFESFFNFSRTKMQRQFFFFDFFLTVI